MTHSCNAPLLARPNLRRGSREPILLAPILYRLTPAMLCDRCRSLLYPSPGGAMLERPESREPTRRDALICSGCGALLVDTDPFVIMREKLAQLARFGLDPEGGPLLKQPRPER